MKSDLISKYFDLVSPDGIIKKIDVVNKEESLCLVSIKNISSNFLGFHLDKKNIIFNIKSTLAQLGLESRMINFNLSKEKKSCDVQLKLLAKGNIAKTMLLLLEENMFIGKLFAIDESRKVREPNYLMRMFGRCDRYADPLLALKGPQERDALILEKIKGHTIAFLPLKKGVIKYNKSIFHFLPTLAKMLKEKKFKTREMLKIHQVFKKNVDKKLFKDDILLVCTKPLHIRTVFAKVCTNLLPSGFYHTSASILQPDTAESGNIYELYGKSNFEITEIPLEFYTLEPYKEYVFFSDRDQLQHYLEKPNALFKAFKTAPKPKEMPASVFIVKGSQLESLKEKDWIKKEVFKHEFPGLNHPSRQALLVEKYIEGQSSYPFLKAIEDDLITSQGILLSRYFPSPLMKKLLISTQVQKCLKGIYFQKPSKSNGIFFSHEDRSFLLDLAKFAIAVFWVDETSKKILKFVLRPEKDSGMFVPIELEDAFRKSTFFGIYGSNLKKGIFEKELENLFIKILNIKKESSHPLLSKDVPIAIVTGGGPGIMEMGNKIAKKLKILSCANILNFQEQKFVNEQEINPYIDIKMTYLLKKLVERQAEFHLDFPIFLPGGIGTDFEYTLEEIRRKVASENITPILLLGTAKYWKEKITSRFQCNLKEGTIAGSEWVSNCFYCAENAEKAAKLYYNFFKNKLPIGPKGPIYKNGFCIL